MAQRVFRGTGDVDGDDDLQLSSGIYRIINEASQSTVRVHQHGRPMQLSYGFELLGIFEQVKTRPPRRCLDD